MLPRSGHNRRVLPTFAMDCRDWLVHTPSQVGLPDELDGAPLLAALSTAVFSPEAFRSVSAVLTIGVADEDIRTRPVAGARVAARVIETDRAAGSSVRYVLPTPDGQLALMAHFDTSDGADAEIIGRIETLMASFRWIGSRRARRMAPLRRCLALRQSTA
jgi:hypothetical protein